VNELFAAWREGDHIAFQVMRDEFTRIMLVTGDLIAV
jgi:hypothetical protein